VKKLLNYLIFVLVITLLAACSSSGESANKEVVQISVERTGGLLTGIGKVKVYIDDEEVMKVKNNHTEAVELSLLPGTHTIQTKGQGDKSDVMEFEVVAGADNIFEFNTEISNIYGVKLKLLNHSNEVKPQEDSQNEDSSNEDFFNELSINGINAEEAIHLSKRLPSYNDLVANGDTFSEPRIYDDVWVIDISRPNGLAEGSIIIDGNRTVSFRYPNGEVDEVTPYVETEQSSTEQYEGELASEYGFLSEEEIFDIAWQHEVTSYIDSPSIEVKVIHYPTEEIPYYEVQAGDFYIPSYYTFTIDAYTGEVINIGSE
jgi:hypothetical protein